MHPNFGVWKNKMRKEYQVYFKGQYLSTIFADSDEEAKIEIASKLEITNIPISEINSETSPNEDTTIPPKKATSKSCFIDNCSFKIKNECKSQFMLDNCKRRERNPS